MKEQNVLLTHTNIQFNPWYAQIDSALLVLERENFSSFISVLFDNTLDKLQNI